MLSVEFLRWCASKTKRPLESKKHAASVTLLIANLRGRRPDTGADGITKLAKDSQHYTSGGFLCFVRESPGRKTIGEKIPHFSRQVSVRNGDRVSKLTVTARSATRPG